MSEPNHDFKPMPLASVLYAVTFDEQGQPTVQGKIHTDAAGRAVFEGDPAKTYLLLQAALETTGKRFAAPLTDQLVKSMEEKRLLNAELQPTESKA